MALRLGATVAELQGRMSYLEFLRWQQFYLEQPFDDIHLYLRPAALIACSMTGADFSETMDHLLNRQVADADNDDELIPDGLEVLAKVKAQFGSGGDK